MHWYGWALVIYIAFDRLCTVGYVGRSLEITPTIAVTTLITGVLLIWAVLALGGVV